MTRILLAGASGYLGRHVVGELNARGHQVQALIRNPNKRSLVRGAEKTVAIDLLGGGEQLHTIMEGVEIIFSSAGQPCTLRRTGDRRSFRQTESQINRVLLDAALACGVRKFVYVAVLSSPQLHALDYVASHEQFVEELEASGIDSTVVRANGFFYSYIDLLEFARRGLAIGFGDGSARSNPIHEADLAVVCVDAIEGSQQQVEVRRPGDHHEA
jgi:uncharacterized protein YbjT (DUF2867 family)